MRPLDVSTAEPLLRSPFQGYDDRSLQEHLRMRMPARIVPQLDAQECQPNKIDDLLMGRYTFVGETHLLGIPPQWLTNPSRDLEWHILLHKFYYAPGLGEAYVRSGDRRYLDTWLTLIRSWIAHTPVGFIAADVTGRRLQNWVYAYAYFAGSMPPDVHRPFLESLRQQTEWLIGNLHRARNHRTLELHAIFLVSVAFDEFAQARQWRDFALGEILANMRADLRPDGVHCEQSTDYHHLVLKNFLSLRRTAQRNEIVVPAEMDEHLIRALEFSMHAHRPDGRVPSLSDGDVHDYRELLLQGHELYGRRDMLYVATLGREGQAPAQRSRVFPCAGYTLLRSGWGTGASHFGDERYLIFDCGPLGEGNHGHFDLLSFEAYAFGQPLVIDPGRYTYHEDAQDNWRVRFRSTEYHNTVLVDEMNQTRYTKGSNKFRVSGPAAEFALRDIHLGERFDLVRGFVRSHEYTATHERTVAFVNGEYWVIVDSLDSDEEHQYDLLFHLSAGAWRRAGLSAGPGTLRVISPHLLIVHLTDEDTRATLEQGYVSEHYGSKRPAPIARFRRRAARTVFTTVLYPFEHELPDVRFEEIGSQVLKLGVCHGNRSFTDLIALGATPGFTRHASTRETVHA